MADTSLDLGLHIMTAKSFLHMLDDLVCADDNVPELDANDPCGRGQRMLACIEGLRGQLEAIGQMEREAGFTTATERQPEHQKEQGG